MPRLEAVSQEALRSRDTKWAHGTTHKRQFLSLLLPVLEGLCLGPACNDGELRQLFRLFLPLLYHEKSPAQKGLLHAGREHLLQRFLVGKLSHHLLVRRIVALLHLYPPIFQLRFYDVPVLARCVKQIRLKIVKILSVPLGCSEFHPAVSFIPRNRFLSSSLLPLLILPLTCSCIINQRKKMVAQGMDCDDFAGELVVVVNLAHLVMPNRPVLRKGG
mmetsp:Transcript_49344/g.120377  ORF Transcript_49344/g.120377 Transcript_49344/m.120377 type:complete len:217 (-) Transcript_49344:276-926(-)